MLNKENAMLTLLMLTKQEYSQYKWCFFLGFSHSWKAVLQWRPLLQVQTIWVKATRFILQSGQVSEWGTEAYKA